MSRRDEPNTTTDRLVTKEMILEIGVILEIGLGLEDRLLRTSRSLVFRLRVDFFLPASKQLLRQPYRRDEHVHGVGQECRLVSFDQVPEPGQREGCRDE